MEIVLACKKCKKVFRKDMNDDCDDADEYCPRYVIDIKFMNNPIYNPMAMY